MGGDSGVFDTEEAYSIVRRLVAALAPGSFLAVNHSTSAVHGAAMREAVAHWNRVGTPTMTLRTPEQIARFFDGLDLVEPGVVSCSRWRPDPSTLGGQPAEVDEFSGVAHKITARKLTGGSWSVASSARASPGS
jgi:O-methyltransferase involved in polyketide biosynthesis